jgi:hypothetical protein
MSGYSLSTKKTWDQTLDDIQESFRKAGIRTWNVTPTRPAKTKLQQHSLHERTVTLSFTAKNGRAVTLTTNRQPRAHDNLRVLYLVVEALRMNELRGFAQEMAEAYRQNYPALPGPGASPTPAARQATPYDLLHLRPSAPIEVCEAAYRSLSKLYHPDVTGSASTQQSLNQAIEQIRKEKRQ